MANRRYLDVLTVRSTATPSSGATRVGAQVKQYKYLLVEPVVIPDLQHLSVDNGDNGSNNQLFYPSGAKSKNMRNNLCHSIRDIYASAEPILKDHHKHNAHEIAAVRKALEKDYQTFQSPERFKRLERERLEAIANPRPVPLVYRRKNDEYKRQVKQLLKKVKSKEVDITSLTSIRV